MKRVVLIVILLLCVIGTGISLGTYAWFTSQATTENNVFQSGELVIGVPNNGTNDGFINLANLFPGKSVNASLDVKNMGDVLFKYKISTIKTGGDQGLFDILTLTISDGTTKIYDGLLKDINKEIGNIEPDKSQTLQFTIKMPESAGNNCQSKMTTTKFIFDATQVENTSWSESGI